MQVAFLGFGLIGGSIARALRSRTTAGGSPDAEAVSLIAWTPSGEGPRGALADGVLEAVATSPIEAIEGADLVVLAGPPAACLAMLDDLAGPWREALADDAVVTDVASTKSAIVLRATALGLRFVGGHPMAGRETTGYASAEPDLFADRPWVVIPSTDAAAVAHVEALARATGARPIRMSAAAHDRAVAGVSHLPLITAAALVEAVAGSAEAWRDGWPDARPLAATGWRDMTRLARGDVAMGTGIATTNAGPLAARLRDLIDVLDGWATDLERPGGPDADAIDGRLRRARATLEASES